MYQTTRANPIPNAPRPRTTALPSFTLCSDAAPSAECAGGYAWTEAKRGPKEPFEIKAPTRWTSRPGGFTTSKAEWLRKALNEPKNMLIAATLGLAAVTMGMLLASLLSLFVAKQSASLVVGWTLLALAAMTPILAVRRPQWFSGLATVAPRLRDVVSHISAVMGR